jgi:hypothetical protein
MTHALKRGSFTFEGSILLHRAWLSSGFLTAAKPKSFVEYSEGKSKLKGEEKA